MSEGPTLVEREINFEIGTDTVWREGGRVPEMALDYYFMGDESETVPHLAKDRHSESNFSTCFACTVRRRDMHWQSWILKLKDDESACLPAVECIPKEAPAGDSRANGAAENVVHSLNDQITTLKTATQDRGGCRRDPEGSPSARIPRDCTDFVDTIPNVLGRAAIRRTTGGRWRRLVVICDERIRVKVTSLRSGRSAGFGATMVLAIGVGQRGRSGSRSGP